LAEDVLPIKYKRNSKKLSGIIYVL